MGLAVLAQPVGERLHAPLLELGDLAAILLDHAFELVGQFLGLLRAQVLARKHDVFIERHAKAFPGCSSSRRQALQALRERLESLSKAGTRDAGPTGPAARLLPMETGVSRKK